MRHAAQLGLAAAQYEVGRRGLFGKVPGIVPEEAVSWLELAAKQGHARACYGLAVCYIKSNGVARDLSSAWMWLTLAAQRDFSKATYMLPLLEDQMDTQQRQTARRLLKARLEENSPTSP